MKSKIKLIFVVIAVFVSTSYVLQNCKPRLDPSALNSLEQDGERSFVIEMATEDISLQGPLAQFVSVVWGVPLFEDGIAQPARTHLPYFGDGSPNILELAERNAKQDPQINEALALEYVGEQEVEISSTMGNHGPGSRTIMKFFGICAGDKTIAFQLLRSSEGETFSEHVIKVGSISKGPDERFALVKSGIMPSTYLPQLKGCRARFEELVGILRGEKAQIDRDMAGIESIHLAAMFLAPAYGGFANVQDGNTALGTAEIVADIASLGLATKFSATIKVLSQAPKLLRSAEKGASLAVIGANAVRLGLIARDTYQRGSASIYDAPSVVFLVAETGFVLMRFRKVRVETPPTQIAGLPSGAVSGGLDATKLTKSVNEAFAQVDRQIALYRKNPTNAQAEVVKQGLQVATDARKRLNTYRAVTSGEVVELESLSFGSGPNSVQTPHSVNSGTVSAGGETFSNSSAVLTQSPDTMGVYVGQERLPIGSESSGGTRASDLVTQVLNAQSQADGAHFLINKGPPRLRDDGLLEFQTEFGALLIRSKEFRINSGVGEARRLNLSANTPASASVSVAEIFRYQSQEMETLIQNARRVILQGGEYIIAVTGGGPSCTWVAERLRQADIPMAHWSKVKIVILTPPNPKIHDNLRTLADINRLPATVQNGEVKTIAGMNIEVRAISRQHRGSIEITATGSRVNYVDASGNQNFVQTTNPFVIEAQGFEPNGDIAKFVQQTSNWQPIYNSKGRIAGARGKAGSLDVVLNPSQTKVYGGFGDARLQEIQRQTVESLEQVSEQIYGRNPYNGAPIHLLDAINVSEALQNGTI